MALGEVTIVNSVYNRVPFITNNSGNTLLIENFASEIMAEVYKPMQIAEADKYIEASYNQLQKSLVADMTAVQFIRKRILSNMEGVGDAGTSSTKILSKGMAGETEVEWEIAKASDGAKLQLAAEKIVNDLMSEAMRKARSLGFLLDISKESEFIVNAYSQPETTIFNASYD